MKLKFKMEYLKKIYLRYSKVKRRKEKKQILDEFCENCEYNRKYAIQLLNGKYPENRQIKKQRAKKFIYKNQTLSILEIIWEAAGRPWSAKLKALIPIWLPWTKKRHYISPEVEKQLLSIGSATIDRRLKNKKDHRKKGFFSTTKPGYLLKHQITIKTHCWDVHKPGFIEIDLVAHCGNSLDGDFIYSLNCTDIHTTWTETRAIMGKSQFETFYALQDIIASFPFPIIGIDSDNGSEFINWHLYRFCIKHNIQFTRSRPYQKNDNAHIEQKNWTHVRKIFGYVRYQSELALKSMNDLYVNELRYFQNLFLPSVKLIKKVQVGSKQKRKYDKPTTPFQRLFKCRNIDPFKIIHFNKLLNSTDPFELSESIDKKLNRIYQLRTVKIKIHNTFDDRLNAEIKKDFVPLNELMYS